jgi:Ca2+-binding RTX toxin-like protein
MKRIISVLAATMVVVGVFGSIAQASSPNVMVGTSQNDSIFGTTGNDAIFGKAGADWLWAGKGHDILYGGRGRDQLRAADGLADQLFGGPGVHDGCVGDKHDTFRGCERIVILNVNGGGGHA